MNLNELLSEMTLKKINKYIGHPHATLDHINLVRKENLLYLGLYRFAETWIALILES
jgi:hypothetical protein